MRRMGYTGPWLVPALWLLLGAFESGCSEKRSEPVVTLEARRDFGYTVGSIVEHRIIVDLAPNLSVDPKLLPGQGPVNDWLDLRTVRWSMPADDQLRLDVGYLILKGVKMPEPTAIPPLSLRIRHGDAVLELHSPEWPFTLMPVIPPDIPEEHVEIRGMRELETLGTATDLWLLVGSLLAATACLFLIALRRGLFPALVAPPPFTAALRELERPSFSLSPAERYVPALKRIHRAIDETAGTIVFSGTLAHFLGHHSAFRSLRSDFEQFFQISEQHFFASVESVHNEAEQARRWHSLVDFCRRCARCERGIA